VLLLVPARTYRAADFLLAATRAGLDLVIGSDGALPLGGRPVIPVSPGDPDGSTRRILTRVGPVDAVVAADAEMLVLAATVAAAMGLSHNTVDAVLCAIDKASQRQRWAAAAVAQPEFRIVPAGAADAGITEAAEAVGSPCVVKAVSLSASQGVLRAEDPAAAVAAGRRIRRILSDAGRPPGEPLLVEEYLPGQELSIDGLLTSGSLTPTAIFDKPRTPDGPTFEETLLVTPSRLPGPVLAAAVRTAEQAAQALGLTTGPVHAELRIGQSGVGPDLAGADMSGSDVGRTGVGGVGAGVAGGGLASVGEAGASLAGVCGQPRPAMLELAARSIGGLCSRALRFPEGKSLEELVLANALGQPVPAASYLAARPCGVFMLPVPREGVLRTIEGRDAAVATPGITSLTITIPLGQRVRPLPDGDRYLGFIFAEADTSDAVEHALTKAARQLHAVIQ